MRRKRQFKARLVSLFLALMLVAGNISVVQAQEVLNEDVQSEVQENVQTEVQENVQIETRENKAAEKEDTGDPEAESGESEPEEVESEREKSVAEVESTDVEPKKGVGITASLRVDGYGETVLYPTSIKLPDTYRTLESYGLGHVKDPGYYTPLHMLAEYCEQNGMNPAEQIDVTADGNVNNFLGSKASENAFMMFAVNNGFPADPSTGWGYVQGTYPLQAGDRVVLYSWHHYNSVYAYFTEENLNVSAGQTFIVTLKSNDGMGSGATSCEGADILVQDTNDSTLESGDYEVKGKTDSKGQAAITINKAGTYLLTAEKKTDGTQHDLNRPYAKIVVSKPITMSDEEAVQSDKAALVIENTEQVKENLVLPTEGKNGTTIKWESADENFVKKDGTVTRPVGADKRVTLTATISKGNVSDTKEITVTVVGKALFKELKVDHGTLVYDKNIDSYTIYVKDEVNKLTISGIAGEEESDVAFLKAKIYEASGKENPGKMVFPENNEGAFSVETWLKDEKGVDLTPQNVTLQTIGNVQGTVTITVKRGNPGKPLPELPDVTWGQHLGDKNNNAVVDAQTPTGEGELLWESFSGAPNILGSVYAGTPILVNNSIYAVRNHAIEMLDAKTGKVKASTKLQSEIGYYSNIIYGGGMIFVPLGNGMIQCFNAATLQSMYLLDAPVPTESKYPYKVYGAMHYENGKLYVGFTDEDIYGCYAAYDTVDIDVDNETELISPLWISENAQGQSYYGSGAVTVEDKLVVAGDSGKVYVYNSKNGEEISSCQLEGKVRSSLVYAEGYVWAATQGNKIYKLSLDESGKITEAAKGELPSITNASPVVVNEKVYITGGGWAGGFFAVYDKNLNLLAQADTPTQLNTPTVTTAYDNVYAYFTENGEEGSLYMAEITADNKITITKIYTPEHPQYSMSKVVVGADGTLYYSNDSGYLYAIQPKSGEEPEGGDDDDGKDDTEEGNKGESDDEETEGKNPNVELKPQTDTTPTVSTQNFKPKARTVRVNATGNKKSTEQNLVESIVASGEKKEDSLTVNNPPETVGAEVFTALKQYPELRMVFNCGSYTLSIKGSDVKNPEATLSTKLTEVKDVLSEEEAAQYGNYVILALNQEGELPGNITVVYELGEQFEDTKELYLYEQARPEEGKEAVVKQPYAMFVIERPGTYILSDTKVEDLQGISPRATAFSEEMLPEAVDEPEVGLPIWAYILIAVGAGAVLGGVVTASVFRARKRKETWEEERIN